MSGIRNSKNINYGCDMAIHGGYIDFKALERTEPRFTDAQCIYINWLLGNGYTYKDVGDLVYKSSGTLYGIISRRMEKLDIELSRTLKSNKKKIVRKSERRAKGPGPWEQDYKRRNNIE